MKTRSGIRLALPLLALCLGLSACSGAPSGGSTTPNVASGSDAGTDFDTAYQEWHLTFASCMRDAGIDYDDPKPGMGVSLDSSDGAAFDAFEACMVTVGNPPVSDQADKQELVAELMVRAQCLRDEGYDVPDPAADGSWELPEELYDAARACATD